MNDNIVTGNGGHGVVFTAQADTIDNWTLSGNQFNTNTLDGMRVTTSQDAVFVLSSTGDQFEGNGGNGVTLTSNNASSIGTFGIPPINGGAATPTTFLTATITGNGGNGMQVTSNSTSTINFAVFSSEIGTNAGDGLAITTNSLSSMQGQIGFGGLGNNIHNNTGNGVNMTTNTQSNLTIDFDSNTISSNTLNGVLGTHNGGTFSQAAVPFGSFLFFIPGSTVQASFENNVISLNGQRGLSVNFTGTASTTGTGYTLTGNTINSNGQEGVFLQTDSGLRTNTFVNVTENFYNSGLFTPPPSTVLSDGFGNSISWVDTTVANDVLFVATDNVIRNNGADGMFLHVGTTGYVHADVQRNNFGGNFLTDFRTDSFISGGQTPGDAILTARSGGTTLEVRTITLDNVARLDLRFTGNGLAPLPPADSMANATAFGATYTPGNSVKNGIGATTDPATHGDIFFPRNASFFRVENDGGPGGTIDTNNVFQEDINNGLTPFGILTNPFTGGYGTVPTGTFTPPMPPLVIP